MHLLAIMFITALWIISIFTFARWRVSTMIASQPSCNVSADPAFQVYLKLSGLGVLGWIGMLLSGSA